MSSDEIVIDGVAFVRSRDAARFVQFTRDYITTLARGGLISGKQINGIWYVNDNNTVEDLLATGTNQ
jgi:hypothetical protein